MSEIARGAEAVISRIDDTLIKERIVKKYRLSQLDEKLRSRRTKLEAALLREARRIGINVPRVFDVQKYSIKMEEIQGKLVKDVLNEKNYEEIMENIGTSIAKLHEYNIVHGDLTTSNMILKQLDQNNPSSNNCDIYFIDFGLGFNSQRIEDKAVDLYLFYHVIEATHWNLLEKMWKIILNTYKAHFKDAVKVIKTLDQIEKRGRYKDRGE